VVPAVPARQEQAAPRAPGEGCNVATVEKLEGLKGALGNIEAYAEMLARQEAAQQQAQAEEAAAAASEIGAMVEAAYLVAVADGELSETEASHIVDGIAHLTDGRFPPEQIAAMVGQAAGRFAEEGQHARIDSVATTIAGPELRRAVFMVAAGVSWLDHGIGEKQGLALQALSRGFDIPMNEMHKLLARAHG
jgi:hypothetical protein